MTNKENMIRLQAEMDEVTNASQEHIDKAVDNVIRSEVNQAGYVTFRGEHIFATLYQFQDEKDIDFNSYTCGGLADISEAELIKVQQQMVSEKKAIFKAIDIYREWENAEI